VGNRPCNPTINVFRGIKVDSQDSARRQGQNEHIICDLRGDKIRRDRELELHPLYVEDG
jgi:hypothetical protein